MTREPKRRPAHRENPTEGVGRGEQVEGRRAVEELFRAGTRRARTVWLSGDGLGDLEERARAAGARVHRVTATELTTRARTASPQGIVAAADPLPLADLDTLLRAPIAFLVALEGVTDPQNLGAALRSAEAAGATGALLARSRAAPITPVVTKAAAGAVEHLPVTIVPGIPAALARARDRAVWTVGLDVAGDTSIHELPIATQPLVLVAGAEGRGLSRLARDRCDVVARIPMAGTTPSLNVATALALGCFEIARARSR